MDNEKKSKKAILKKWWFWLIVILIIAAMSSGNDKDNNTVVKNENVTKNNEVSLKLGDDGYLRIDNNNDPEQVIILTDSKEAYEKVTTALLAKDYQGLMEIPGAFGVSNGTKIKIVDSEVGIRRVRILEGVREIDTDKIGRAGWVAKEFIKNE